MFKYIIIVLVTLTLILQCIDINIDTPQQPLVIVLVLDQSKSGEINKLPIPQPKHIDELITLVQTHGGSFSYMTIRKEYEPAVRITLQALGDKTLKDRATLKQQQREEIQILKKKVTDSINDKNLSMRSNVWEVLLHADRLFNEITVNSTPKKICWIISDLEDDVKRFKPQRLADDVNIINIGQNVYRFESIEKSISFIQHIAKGGYHEKKL